MTRTILITFAAALLSAPAVAAECPVPSHDAMAMDQSMDMGTGGPAGDDAHKALMAGMDAMNADMMAGGTAADLDVAFICAMIPHHQGAIDMAKAELAHGDDPWARDLAQKIIAAQTAEIAAMEEWVKAQP
jgi:uncharacterized protein (DUF305 family)